MLEIITICGNSKEVCGMFDSMAALWLIICLDVDNGGHKVHDHIGPDTTIG